MNIAMVARFACVPLILSCLLFCTACTKPAEEENSTPRSGDGSGGSIGEGDGFKTSCGVVHDGDLSNPISREDGSAVRVKSVAGANLVILQKVDQTEPSPEFLVKLHGIRGAQRQESAMHILERLSFGTVYFFPAEESCAVDLAGGGKGLIGQVVTGNGKSFSEELAQSGLADVDAGDACGGDQIGSCLDALKATEKPGKGEMRKFLWKPLSDTKGNIAVIHELHCNTEVFVNGEQWVYVGGGNGRCGTFKASRPGCAYGGNIKVEVIDKASGQPYTHAGQPFVTVPSGCGRFEFD